MKIGSRFFLEVRLKVVKSVWLEDSSNVRSPSMFALLFVMFGYALAIRSGTREIRVFSVARLRSNPGSINPSLPGGGHPHNK